MNNNPAYLRSILGLILIGALLFAGIRRGGGYRVAAIVAGIALILYTLVFWMALTEKGGDFHRRLFPKSSPPTAAP